MDRYFWGYMNTDRFTKFVVPESEGFKGSKSYHESFGLCKVPEEAEKKGRLRTREMFCACDPCLELDIDACKMQSAVGKAVYANVGPCPHARPSVSPCTVNTRPRVPPSLADPATEGRAAPPPAGGGARGLARLAL